MVLLFAPKSSDSWDGDNRSDKKDDREVDNEASRDPMFKFVEVDIDDDDVRVCI